MVDYVAIPLGKIRYSTLEALRNNISGERIFVHENRCSFAIERSPNRITFIDARSGSSTILRIWQQIRSLHGKCDYNKLSRT